MDWRRHPIISSKSCRLLLHQHSTCDPWSGTIQVDALFYVKAKSGPWSDVEYRECQSESPMGIRPCCRKLSLDTLGALYHSA